MNIEYTSGGSVDVRALRRLAREQTVYVGHVGGLMHPAREGGKPIENAALARALHDGTATIVARPYLMQGIRSGMTAIMKMVKVHYLLVKQGKSGLDRVGATMVAAVQDLVRSGYYRGALPNASSTIRQKGSDTPLIDTAFLINSVTFTTRQGPPARTEQASHLIEVS
jgi:hypothetical protein